MNSVWIRPGDPIDAPRRRVWVAVLLGLFGGTAAQVYCGRMRRAVLIEVALLAFSYVTTATMLYLWLNVAFLVAVCVVYLVAKIAVVVDAALLAKQRPIVPWKRYQRWWAYLLWIVAVAVIGSLLSMGARAVWAEVFYMPTRPMVQTVLPGDYVIADKLVLRFRAVQHGDVVMHFMNAERRHVAIKRVIGMPGDVIEVRGDAILRNGERLDEPYVYLDDTASPMYDDVVAGPITVEQGKLFVCGDNRRRSSDSRSHHYGQVPVEDVIGVARVVLMSRDCRMDESGRLKCDAVRWERFGVRLDGR